MLEYIRKIGVSATDTTEEKTRKYTLLLIVCGCFTAAPLWSYAYYLLELKASAMIPLVYAAAIIPFVILFAYTQNEKLLVNAQIVAIFIAPVVMQWLAGGFMKGGPVILWSFLSPLTALVFLDVSKARTAMIMLITAIIGTMVFNDFFEQYGSFIDKRYRIILDCMNAIGPILVVFFAMQYFVKTISKSNRLLSEERKKTESLLLNIFPPHVADELKKSGKVTPMLYQDTTIIFTDFKDFTKFSQQLTPEELIAELGKCFEKFDEIITHNGLEKIKTIGDAYMCVGGIFSEQVSAKENAKRAVQAAVEIADYIAETKKQHRAEGRVYWDIRIGVHTGDIVAGIVGKKKFAFDIWGDAVNTASRLETSGEAGRVNISGDTYKLIKDSFNCEYRGKLPIKNKGELDMYFVEAEKTMA